MKDHQDAYGHLLYDRLEGANSSEIAERDDGYIDTRDAKWYFSGYKYWPPHQKKAMRFVRGKVLDIGCGAGKHSLHLQEKGLDVLGIDISPLAVEVCKARGLRQAKAASIAQVSSSLGIFDTILMLGNNFGLFGDFKKARRLLKKFHRITQNRARIIAQTLDPYNTTDPPHLEYHELNRRKGRMGGQTRLRIRYKKYATPWFDYLFVSRDEMKQILEGTGWVVNLFIDSEGPTYVAIIEKQRS